MARRKRIPAPTGVDEAATERRSKMLEQRLALQAGLAEWATNGRHRRHAADLDPQARLTFVEVAAVEHFGLAQVDGFIRSQDAAVAQRLAVAGKRTRLRRSGYDATAST